MKIGGMINGLAVELPGCPRPVIERKLRQVWDEFLRSTAAWRQEVAFVVPAGSDRFDLADLLLEGDVDHVLWAQAGPGPVRYTLQGSEFVLGTAGSADTDIRAGLALILSVQSSEVPDEVAGRWWPVVEDGVLAELYAQNQPWGHGALSGRHDVRYRRGLGRARGEMASGRVPVRHEAFGRVLG